MWIPNQHHAVLQEGLCTPGRVQHGSWVVCIATGSVLCCREAKREPTAAKAHPAGCAPQELAAVLVPAPVRKAANPARNVCMDAWRG